MILFIFIVASVLACIGVLIRNAGDYKKDVAARIKKANELRCGK